MKKIEGKMYNTEMQLISADTVLTPCEQTRFPLS